MEGPFIEQRGPIDRFTVAIEDIHKLGRNKAAQALQNARNAVMTSDELSDTQKQDNFEAVTRIAEEVAKKKPKKNVIHELKVLLRQPPKNKNEEDTFEKVMDTLFKILISFTI